MEVEEAVMFAIKKILRGGPGYSGTGGCMGRSGVVVSFQRVQLGAILRRQRDVGRSLSDLHNQ